MFIWLKKTDGQHITILQDMAVTTYLHILRKRELIFTVNVIMTPTVFHIAALCGYLSLCKILEDKRNFDVDMTDIMGWTVLHCSVLYGSYDLFTYFADMVADKYLKDNNGSNCLHIAALMDI